MTNCLKKSKATWPIFVLTVEFNLMRIHLEATIFIYSQLKLLGIRERIDES